MPAETHVVKGGGDTRGVGEVVYEVVAEVTGRDITALADGDVLEALGVHGLVLIDVVEAVGEELGDRTVGLEVDDDELAGARTLGELVALVSEGLGRG